MKKRRMKKLTAALLCTAMVLGLTPVQALETAPEAVRTEYELHELPQNIRRLLPEDTQVQSVRKDDDLYSITTNNGDGTHTATVFAAPVKYQTEDGKTELIDTSIVSNGLLNSVFQGYQYKNKANSFTTEFSEDADKGIRLTARDSRLVMTPVTEETAPPEETAAEEAAVYGLTASQPEEPVHAELPCEITASVEETEADDAFVYENVFGAHTRVKYYNTGTGFKEEIILEKNIGKNRFSFEIDTHGDIPRLTEDGEMVLVYDKDNSEEHKYCFGTLYAYDSFDAETDEASEFEHLTFDCHYELEEVGESRYRITAVVSEEWLNHPETIYPVTIDPSVDNGPKNVDDTYVRESEPNKNYYLKINLRIGNYNGKNYNDGICYSYLKFKNMPELSDVIVTDATLNVDLLSGQTTAQPAKAWRVTSSWSSRTLTWNNRPTHTGATAETAPNGLTDYSFDVSSIVNKWYNGAANYGFMLSYSDQSIKDLNSVYSSDCGILKCYPKLTFEYKDSPILSVVPDGVYFIRNQNSGKYIDAQNAGTALRTNIFQFSFRGGANQQWQITRAEGNWYTIRPMHAPNMSMDVQNAGTENGTNVFQFTYNGGDHQKFGFVKLSNGAYRIVTKHTHGAKGLSVNGKYTYDRANIHLWTYRDGTNDHWFLEEVEFGNGGDYRQVNDPDINCFAYAMFVDEVNINMFLWPSSHTSEDFSGKFQGAIEGTGKTCRRIETYVSPISSDEYRVAIRVPNLLDGVHRYHVIYQLSDGTWAGKDDDNPSLHFGRTNPSTSPEMWSNDAYSPSAGTIYFAVKR